VELRDLQFFCLTAEMEHVSNAAEKLGVAQPFLSKILGQVEADAGVKLFDKTGRRVRLNEFGEIFYEHAKKVLAEVDVLRTEIDFAIKNRQHTITMICNTEGYVSELFVEFQKLNPSYSLRVIHVPREDMQGILNTGDADFAFCCPPLRTRNENIITEEIFHDIGCVMLPKGHPLLNKKSITIEDIKEIPLITHVKGTAMRNSIDPIFEKYGVHPNIICETDDTNMIIHAVKNGAGYSFITYGMLYRYPEAKKYCVDGNIQNKVGHFGISYSKFSENNRNAEHFKEFAKQYFVKMQEFIDNFKLND